MSTAAATEPRFRLKFVPLLVTAVLGFGLPVLAAMLAATSIKLFNLAIVPGDNIGWLYLQHTYQLLVALVAIAVLKFWLVPADYGLHWPRGKSYILPAVLWGIAFGILMFAADYFLSSAGPHLDFAPTQANLWGWALFEGIYVGPTEEIPFRALLVTYLAATMPGKLRIGRFEMNWAGILVAVIFALLHAESFWSQPFATALAQQGYAFALGVLYAYWLEKSRSVVAPAIGHNLSDGVEFLILYVWTGVF